MNETKHTPGPWTIEIPDKRSTDVKVCGPIGSGFVAYLAPHDLEVVQANAHLIAAAPEMLETLKALCGTADSVMGAIDWPEYRQARTAITKAIGD